MKNILIISTDLNAQGGISTVVKLLINSSLKDKYNLLHLSTHINGTKLIKFFVMIKAYSLYPVILIVKNISLVHIHGGMKSSFFRKSYFLLLAKLFGKRVIYHMHSAMVNEYLEKGSKLKKFIVCRLFNLYDVIVVISKSWAKVIQKRTKTTIRIIYNPVSLPSIDKFGKSSGNDFIVFTLGEIGRRKGTEDIVKVAQHLKNRRISFRIAGGGDLKKYHEIAKKFNVREKIEFLGWIDEKQREEEFILADIYFLPSYHEGLPMSILEAISYGLPIISTPVGGISEIIENEINGFLVKPGNIESFVDKIIFLHANEEARKKMGIISRKIAEDKFCIKGIVRQIDEVYNELLVYSKIK